MLLVIISKTEEINKLREALKIFDQEYEEINIWKITTNAFEEKIGSTRGRFNKYICVGKIAHNLFFPLTKKYNLSWMYLDGAYNAENFSLLEDYIKKIPAPAKLEELEITPEEVKELIKKKESRVFTTKLISGQIVAVYPNSEVEHKYDYELNASDLHKLYKMAKTFGGKIWIPENS